MPSQIHLENPGESQCAVLRAKPFLFAIFFILFCCVAKGKVEAPVITSATTARGTVGSAFSYQITATNAPSSYGTTKLPAGLAVKSGTGLISGTPTAAGTSTVTLRATNRGGTGKATLTITIAVAPPSLTSLSPSSANAGAAAQILTINGTNFVASSTVTYNKVAHAATYVSATQLKITLTTSDQATQGTYAVVVTNPAPGGGASNAVNFTVDNPLPTLTSLSPSSANAGAAAQTLTLNGTNFVASSTVTYNGVAHAATYVSATQLKITLTTSDQATQGTYAVVVTNPAPGGGASNSLNFTVNNPVPSLTSLSPTSATAGAAAQTLTINGKNFLSTSAVTYNGAAHTPTYMSATRLTITLSTADQATAGTYPVVVTNPGPGGGTSNLLEFTVTAPIAGLSPTSFTFASQPATTSSSPESFTLTNTGDATLTITSIGFTGTNPGDFSQNTTCGTTLAPTTTCTIAVIFTPTASGSRSGTLAVTDNSKNVAGSTQSSTLAGTGAHDVVLTWTDSPTSGIEGYYIYRGTTTGGEGTTPLNSSPVSATNYSDTNVTAGTTYYYVITAVASNGTTQSSASNEASATVPTQ